MTGKGQKGASPVDFDLYEEFKKPWTAVAKLKERCKIGTRKSRAWLQFIGALVVGISILLLGAAMNTIAIPKSRWWPDTRFEAPQPPDDRFYFANQTSRVASVSRMPLWGQAWEMIREGGTASWEMVRSSGSTPVASILILVRTTGPHPRCIPQPQRIEQIIRHFQQ